MLGLKEEESFEVKILTSSKAWKGVLVGEEKLGFSSSELKYSTPKGQSLLTQVIVGFLPGGFLTIHPRGKANYHLSYSPPLTLPVRHDGSMGETISKTSRTPCHQPI